MANKDSIYAFEVKSTGQVTQIPGSPFTIPFLLTQMVSDPQARFLLVFGEIGRGMFTLVPARIDASHALILTGTSHLSPGFSIVDPVGRFVFSTDNPFTVGTPIHVYSVTADLSFPEVPGSPFLSDIRPAAVDPAGTFIFGFETAQIDSIQISASGALTKTASVYDYEPIFGYVHPSGRFFYAQGLSETSEGYDLQVYRIDSAGTLTAAASEPNFASGKTFFFSAFHPSGNFLFSSACTTDSGTCSIDTLPINVDTGVVSSTPTYSLPGRFGYPALDSTGARLFTISSGASCTAPGVMSVYSVSVHGELRPTGATAQTGACPSSVLVTE